MEDRPDYAASRVWQGTTAVPENMADRPDYHGSLNPLEASQRKALFNPNDADLLNPADKVRRRLIEGNQALQFGSYSTSPIKVFTVCVNSEMGGERYMAFLGSGPTKKAVAGTRAEAVATLLAEQKLIVMTEID